MYAFPFSLTVDLTARDDAIPKEFACSKNQRWGSRAQKQWCQIQSEDQKICTLLPSWCNAGQKSHIPYCSISLYIDAISKVSVTVTVHRRCRYRVTVSTCAAHVLYTQRLRACKSHISTVRVCLCLISGKCVVCTVYAVCSVHSKNLECVYLLLQNTNHILNSHKFIYYRDKPVSKIFPHEVWETKQTKK